MLDRIQGPEGPSCLAPSAAELPVLRMRSASSLKATRSANWLEIDGLPVIQPKSRAGSSRARRPPQALSSKSIPNSPLAAPHDRSRAPAPVLLLVPASAPTDSSAPRETCRPSSPISTWPAFRASHCVRQRDCAGAVSLRSVKQFST